jgi:rod shape-determining protein MreC
MSKLLQFLYRSRIFLVFLFLEGVSVWLIVSKNSYPRSAFLHSSSVLIANTLAVRSQIMSYFQLKEVNEVLAYENAQLILELESANYLIQRESLNEKSDSVSGKSFSYHPAKVINNSTLKTNNYLTIDKGVKDGIKKGMGVISGGSVVGLVHETSDHFATIVSVLNPKLLISCRIKPSGTLGVLQWKAGNPREVQLNFVPRHIYLQNGDSVFTSGFNSALPEGLLIGIIYKKGLNADEAFHQLMVSLSLDFSRLDYVYICKSNQKAERDSLEMKLISEP